MSQFSEKTGKFDGLFSKLSKRRKVKIQITGIKDEQRRIMSTKEI